MEARKDDGHLNHEVDEETTRWTRRGAVAEDIIGHASLIAPDRELWVGAVVFVGGAAGRLFRR